ncbi:UDP-glucose 4-epimerase GalE [Candidatus Saccharibacteria bacterium]|nr:UDP-glucose 4-epimerase GalE [Candidatus Saccharibacteria bacterium]
MKLLVVGGAGYIGSHFVRVALDAGHEIIVADNLTTGHAASVDPRAQFQQLDILDQSATEQLLKAQGIEAVVHFAAFSLVGESMTHPLKYFQNNTAGMISLLEAMQKSAVKKLIFSSTAAVYGIPETTPITEDMPAHPINPYGASKLQMEQIMSWAHQIHGIRGVALRYFNVAGGWPDGRLGEDHRPETHLVPNVLAVPLGKSPAVKLYGDDYDTPDGTCIRDYVHPIDLAHAHLLALSHLEKHDAFDIFNLGSSTGFSVKQIIQAAEKVVGQPIPTEVQPRRPGDPAILVADSSRARQTLDWQPAYDDVEQIIQTAWAWHRSHPDGYPD